MIDILFLIGGIILLIWGVIAVANAQWAWKINVWVNRQFANKDVGEQSDEWPYQIRRMGWFAIVIAVGNIVLSILALA